MYIEKLGINFIISMDLLNYVLKISAMRVKFFVVGVASVARSLAFLTSYTKKLTLNCLFSGFCFKV